jgi:WD40 repeat protein
MPTFEITVRRGEQQLWAVVAEYTADGALLPVRAEGSSLIDEAQLRVLDGDPVGYGTALGQAIFQHRLRDAFTEALGESAASPLRVLLFVDAPELVRLRWERLCAMVDGSWRQLATFQRTTFSHYLPSLTDRHFVPLGRADLRALLVSASPPGLSSFGLGQFDEVAALSGVREALGSLPSHTLSSAKGADPPTLDELCRQLTATYFPLLHVVCHGRALADGESVIYLARSDDPREVDPITATRLIDRLSRLQGVKGLPHLTFLSSCESAIPAAAGAMGGMAHRLVRELGLPAVVAMSDKISVATVNQLAAGFYQRLLAPNQGEPDRALVEVSASLAERPDISVPALFSRLGGRRLFDELVDSPLSPEELPVGLQRLKDCLRERAPVLVEEITADVEGMLRPEGGDGPELKEAYAAARARLEQLAMEATGLSLAALARGVEPPPYDARCPFPGLAPFREDSQAFFFGREGEVEALVEWLAANPCLALIGPSGSGKSSLIRAGLMPALQRLRPGLRVAWCTPGEMPLANLCFAIEQQRQEAAAAGVPDAPIAVLVDQLEELFTLCASEEERQAFIAHLVTLPQHHLTVLAMRSDFVGECGNYQQLNNLVIPNVEQIGPLSADALRSAIEHQAAAVGLRFEAGLTERLLGDVRDEPGAMPLLQHALHELWRRRRGRWLRAAEYQAIGGVQQSIAHTADEIYKSADAKTRARMRDIFVRLTRIDQDGDEEERRDMRQRVSFAELVPDGADVGEIMALVDRLVSSRLVVMGAVHAGPIDEAAGADARGSVQVEVAHEALIRHWPRLRTWLSEDRSALLLRAAIRHDLHDWIKRGCEPDGLLRGGKLQEAERLLHEPRSLLNADECNYIAASIHERDQTLAKIEADRRAALETAKQLSEEQRARAEEGARFTARQQRLLRFLRVLAVVAALACVVAGVLFFHARAQEVSANDAKQAANDQLATAEATIATLEAQRDSIQAEVATVEAVHQRERFVAASEYDFSQGNHERALAYALRALELNPSDPTSQRLLAQAADAPGVRLRLDGHLNVVNAVALNPNRPIGLSGGEDGAVILWNLATGALMDRYNGKKTSAVTAAAFAPHGDTFAVGRSDGSIALHTMTQVKSFEPSEIYAVTDLAFGADGATLLSAHRNGVVRIWDLATMESSALRLSGHSGPVNALAVDKLGAVVASAGEDGTVRIWDLASGAELLRLGGSTSGSLAAPFRSLALAPDGSRLFVGDDDGQISIWETAEPAAPVATLRGHTGGVLDLVLDTLNNRLISASWDGTVRAWDLGSRREIRRFVGHSSRVRSISINASGSQILSGSEDGSVRLWDVNDHSEAARASIPNVVTEVAVARDGQTYYTAERGGKARIWSGALSSQRGLFEAESVAGLALSSDGRLGAIATSGGDIVIWDALAEPPVERDRLRGDGSPLTSLALSHDGKRVVSGAANGTVALWDVASGVELARYALRGRSINQVLFVLGGSRVAIAASDRIGRVWDPELNKVRVSFTAQQGQILSLAVSPDGRNIASGSMDRSIWLWRAVDGEPVRRIGLHDAGVLSLAFTADGKQLVSSSYDGTVRVWEVATGAELRRYNPGFGAATAVAVIPGEQREQILAATSDSALVQLNIHSLSALRRWAGESRYVPPLPQGQDSRGLGGP